MTTRLITPPAQLAVSLDDAKLALRIDGNELDVVVDAWLRGIIDHAEHYMQRAIINQTWRVTLDAFPDAIRLDMSPIVSVTSVNFYDADNALQTLDPADYLLDNVSEPGYVVPTLDKTWPGTASRINAVQVDYVCGFGATPADVPDGIRSYLLAKLADQYQPGKMPSGDVQESFIDRLLDRYKVYA